MQDDTVLQQETPQRRYAAFISYRHQPADRAWAKWLLNELEAFRTPSALVKRGFRARIGLLYRDEDENPASAELTSQIETALAASDAMVVVASPATPHSRWISREVRLFQEAGKGAHIHVLLTDGEPAGSYPPGLLSDPDREPISADVRPRTGETQAFLKRMAKLRLAAALLGCGFDELRRRDRERQQRRLAAALLALVLALFVGGANWFALARAAARNAIDQVALDANEKAIARPFIATSLMRALPRRDLLAVGLPPAALRFVGPVARTAAVTMIDPPTELDQPTVLAAANASDVVVGGRNGAVGFHGEKGWRLLLPALPCSPDAVAQWTCAASVIAADNTMLAVGTMSGNVRRVFVGGATADLKVSDHRISGLLPRPNGTLLVADMIGKLFLLRPDGSVTRISEGGGPIVRLLAEPSGGVLVLRTNGRIDRLDTQGRLGLFAQSPRFIRDGGWIDGQLMTIEITKDSAFASSRSVRVVTYDPTPRILDFTADEPSLFPYDDDDGVAFAPRGDRFLTGGSVLIHEIRPAAKTMVSWEIPSMGYIGRDEQGFIFEDPLAFSRDERFVYSLHAGTLVQIDTGKLAKINAALEAPSGVRAKLCALGIGARLQDPAGKTGSSVC